MCANAKNDAGSRRGGGSPFFLPAGTPFSSLRNSSALISQAYLLVGLPKRLGNLFVLFLASACLLPRVDDLDHHQARHDALSLRMSHLLSGLCINALAELERYVLERGDLRNVLELSQKWDIDERLDALENM